MKYPPVHINDVPISKMEEKNGWNISEFRLPITGESGSSTTVFHSIFKPGSTHSKHLHSRCPEIAMYLKGHGVVGQGSERTNVRAGHFRVMPKNSEHFFHNETTDSDAEVIGFYIGAKDVEDTGYEYCGPVTEEDLKKERTGFNEGILVHIDDIEPEKMDEGDGWSITDFRLPISKKMAQLRQSLMLNLCQVQFIKNICIQIVRKFIILYQARVLQGLVVNKHILKLDIFIIYLKVSSIGFTTRVKLTQFMLLVCILDQEASKKLDTSIWGTSRVKI